MDSRAYLVKVAFKGLEHEPALAITLYGANAADAVEQFLAKYRPVVANVNVISQE